MAYENRSIDALPSEPCGSILIINYINVVQQVELAFFKTSDCTWRFPKRQELTAFENVKVSAFGNAKYNLTF